MNYPGLTAGEAREALRRYGLNEIEEKKEDPFQKIFRWLLSPISLMFFGALVLTWVAGRFFDFYLIVGLMALNFGVSFWQERKADDAIARLRAKLLVRVRVLRSGTWKQEESKYLVPGDAIELGVGDLVPADAEVLGAANLSVNEAALTGESLPKAKSAGDRLYSGSFVATGIGTARVARTGKNTEFGKTLFLIDRSLRRSILEKDILSISRLISIASVVAMALLSAALLWRGFPPADLLLLDLSLLIAGIPVSLPTVMTIIIALGTAELAQKNAIVRRLSSLEDLANVNLLLTDKTGTLTKNELAVTEVVAYGAHTENDVVRFSALAAVDSARSQIDAVIAKKAAALRFSGGDAGAVIASIPADSERKRSSVIVEQGGKRIAVSLGAAQVIEGLCAMDDARASKFAADVARFGEAGYRVLALAVNRQGTEERGMELAGLLAIADAEREEAKDVVDFMRQNHVDVKMVTGDNRAVSARVAADLGFSGETAGKKELALVDWDHADSKLLAGYAVFSEVLPIDKYRLVTAAKRSWVVAVTGDGVNDLPALKAADVGIAVSNAVDALKGAADIVLLAPGIAVIRDALIEARKIFARLYVYSVYRISESLRVIVTIGVLGVVYGNYPLTAVQLILLALLNDIPIISLAFNRVQAPQKPAEIHPRRRLLLSSLYGMSGVLNSLILYFLLVRFTGLGAGAIQTIYFLKLTVSGHMLIYVAHTKERWWRFLPSRGVVITTIATQLLASVLAGTGLFMPHISLPLILMVWGWSFLWMQVSEGAKVLHQRVLKTWVK